MEDEAASVPREVESVSDEAIADSDEKMPPFLSSDDIEEVLGGLSSDALIMFSLVQKHRDEELPLFICELVEELHDRSKVSRDRYTPRKFLARSFDEEWEEMVDHSETMSIANHIIRSVNRTGQKFLRYLQSSLSGEKKMELAFRLVPKLLRNKSPEFENQANSRVAALGSQPGILAILGAVIESPKFESKTIPITKYALCSEERTKNNDISVISKRRSAIPRLAELGIELDQFEERERGGLLYPCSYRFYESLTALQVLCGWFEEGKMENRSDSEKVLLEKNDLSVIQALKDKNLLRKEDVREHDLLMYIFSDYCHNTGDPKFFASEKFRFLSDLDPSVLTVTIPRVVHNDEEKMPLYRIVAPLVVRHETGMPPYLPIHCAAAEWRFDAFLTVFEAGMKHYPKRVGFVFVEGMDATSDVHQVPYFEACNRFGEDRVTAAVWESICKCSETENEHILLSVIQDEDICLDGLYVLLRNDPEAVLQVLRAYATIV